MKISQLFSEIKNTFTYELWVKPLASHNIDNEMRTGTSGIRGQRYIIAPGDGGNGSQAGVGLSIGINGVSIYEHTLSHLPATLVYEGNVRDWNHIAIVYKEKTPFLYLNGEFIKKGLTSSIENVVPSGYFGALEPYGYFIGQLADLRIWNHARTEDQIKVNMNRKLTGKENGLYRYWSFKNNENNVTTLSTLYNKYPDYILNHLDLLKLFGILNSDCLDGSFYRSNKKEPFDSNKININWYQTDVLIDFGYYRKDYEELLYPLANSLIKKGKSVSLLIYKFASPPTTILSDKVNIIYKEHLDDQYRINKQANTLYKTNLAPSIDKWCKDFQINGEKRLLFERIYRSYAVENIRSKTLLNLLKPRCVLGIHFLMNPGSIDAINFFSESTPIKNILVQHGFFGRNLLHPHDFKGADIVILWGDFHQKLLNNLPISPNSVVIGNPKLELKFKKYNTKQNIQIEKNITKILYVFSTSPEQDPSCRSNLNIFIQAIKKLSNIKVLYKLHPSFPSTHLSNYLKNNAIHPDEIFKGEDVYNAINISDIIVGDFSTSIFEAAALNKPVIQIASSNTDTPFVVLNHVKNSKELIEVINNLRTDSAFMNKFSSIQKNSIKELFNLIDGTSDKITDFIIDLITFK
ncbi:LamG-like jellyroll fold domain-containing protein [Metabacillus herbersteinensis]|uniref:LamG-like jellyroll fold domain-containing protein n=1 Tax=Metabacillus herbersteinensis TaxID=283816 RepID=A0ABV6GE13_9BACI